MSERITGIEQLEEFVSYPVIVLVFFSQINRDILYKFLPVKFLRWRHHFVSPAERICLFKIQGIDNITGSGDRLNKFFFGLRISDILNKYNIQTYNCRSAFIEVVYDVCKIRMRPLRIPAQFRLTSPVNIDNNNIINTLRRYIPDTKLNTVIICSRFK